MGHYGSGSFHHAAAIPRSARKQFRRKRGEAKLGAAAGAVGPVGLAVTNASMQNGTCRVKVRFSAPLGSGEQAGRGVHFRLRLAAPHNYWSATKLKKRPGLRSESDPFRPGDEGVRRWRSCAPTPSLPSSRGAAVGPDCGVPRAFIDMQFAEPYDNFYREVIQKEAAAAGYEVTRINEKAGPGVIFQDMQREIEQAEIVIAEITPANPNVFYELGYAHALGKPTILLAQRDAALPFDIRSYRVVFYNDTTGGKTEVERNLRRYLEAISEN